jgi:CRP/FNR family cyclic AMP-dependent transcriptional regulator
MISPELLRRYPFFAGLTADQLVTIARSAEELEFEAGQYLFHEGRTLNTFYLILEGKVDITIGLLEHGEKKPSTELAEKRREIVLSTVSAGEIFAWSALVPPHHATSNGRAATNCRVVAFDRPPLQTAFEADPSFGYQMMLRVAQIARDRLQSLHNESLGSL